MKKVPLSMSQKDVEILSAKYPVGTRVRMVTDMDDPQPILAGETGTVKFVDGMGQIHVRWDSGRALALNSMIDSFEKI